MGEPGRFLYVSARHPGGAAGRVPALALVGPGRHADDPLEVPVEMGLIGESGFRGDLGRRHAAVEQPPGGSQRSAATAAAGGSRALPWSYATVSGNEGVPRGQPSAAATPVTTSTAG